MKKSIIAVASAMLLAGCGFTGGTATNNGSDLGNVLGSILGAVTQGDAVTNILYDVIGATKLSKEDVVGTWSYRGPGVAFTSENLLAKAGGEVAAAKARQDLEKPYQSIGIKSTNTYFTFNADNTFSGKVDGQPISGTYSYNPDNSEVKLQTLLLSTTGYLTRNAKGISLLFESKKLLTALQVVGAMSGNSTLSTVGELSKNYDGIRMGFDLTK
ncbi:MAG: DUF4923 family protein [Prevotella sp.]|nr:DUF4923 family protein [Prevotella sp.]MBQ1773346.1 DUF4923 family protein [Prevotella sp.]